MQLHLPPYEGLQAPAGKGGALRAAASNMLRAEGVVMDVQEPRTPEQIAVDMGYVVPEELLAAHGLSHILPQGQ
jgi:hypothetical protein